MGVVSIQKLERFTIIDDVVSVAFAGSDTKEVVIDTGVGNGDPISSVGSVDDEEDEEIDAVADDYSKLSSL